MASLPRAHDQPITCFNIGDHSDLARLAPATEPSEEESQPNDLAGDPAPVELTLVAQTADIDRELCTDPLGPTCSPFSADWRS